MNTAVESIYHGVSVIAIPVTDDQPGVAARIEWGGLGVALPFRKLRVDRLQEYIGAVLMDGKYRTAVTDMQVRFQNIDRLGKAADIVERALPLI
jgi:zeaxanthin glucosyltransferase